MIAIARGRARSNAARNLDARSPRRAQGKLRKRDPDRRETEVRRMTNVPATLAPPTFGEAVRGPLSRISKARLRRTIE
ncbi:MAG TPA: hypothetical protein VFG69_09090 [Nannocystaceae bacterium]|nr:hypothetical protein [Nannocystaceae bacterium]